MNSLINLASNFKAFKDMHNDRDDVLRAGGNFTSHGYFKAKGNQPTSGDKPRSHQSMLAFSQANNKLHTKVQSIADMIQSSPSGSDEDKFKNESIDNVDGNFDEIIDDGDLHDY